MSSEQDFLTIEEAADILRLKRATVWGLCRDGKLPAFKLPGGKRWLIDRKELLALQKQQKKNYDKI
jgi:excisionase family DNA binding protein